MKNNWILNNCENLDDIKKVLDVNLIKQRLNTYLDINDINSFISDEDILTIISSILKNRNINTKELINKTINNPYTSFISPYELTNCKTAADIISNHISNKDNYVYIYGDYDCDGIMGNFVFSNALKEVSNCTIETIYPERISGYGMNIEFCNSIIQKHKNNPKEVLVITVDNGITKVDEVKLLLDNEINVIITDHHLSQDKIPNCLIVNPHNEHEYQNDNTKHLSGCTVAFKLAQLIQHNFNKNNMLKYVPYVTMTIISDVMPLSLENLAFINYGLEIINSENCPIFFKLLKGLLDIKLMTVKDIAWTIAPIINSCGRMNNTKLSEKMLNETNLKDRNKYIQQAIDLNDSRKKMTKKLTNKVLDNFIDSKIAIYIDNENEISAGIIGVLAGKLLEFTNKTSMVLSKTEDGICHGSVRNVEDFDIISLFKDMENKKIINSFGGHNAACAINFQYDKLEDIIRYFDENINYAYNKEDLSQDNIYIDLELVFEYIDLITLSIANIFPTDDKYIKSPIFLFRNIKIINVKSVTNPDRGWITLESNGIWKKIFCLDNFQEYKKIYENKNTINIVANISKAFWCKDYYTLNIKDYEILQ